MNEHVNSSIDQWNQLIWSLIQLVIETNKEVNTNEVDEAAYIWRIVLSQVRII